MRSVLFSGPMAYILLIREKTGYRKGDELMPRGKRKTCGEKLEELREQINMMERQLQELKAKEKTLLQEKREKELKQIAEILEERNVTVEELPELLDQTLASSSPR